MQKTPAELLREAREKSGRTQAEIAADLGVTQPQIAKWESGKSLPKTEDVRRVAEVYGIRPERLLPASDAA